MVDLLFEIVLKSISNRHLERGRRKEMTKERGENCPNSLTRTYSRHSRLLLYYLSKIVGRPGTESYPAPYIDYKRIAISDIIGMIALYTVSLSFFPAGKWRHNDVKLTSLSFFPAAVSVDLNSSD